MNREDINETYRNNPYAGIDKRISSIGVELWRIWHPTHKWRWMNKTDAEMLLKKRKWFPTDK